MRGCSGTGVMDLRSEGVEGWDGSNAGPRFRLGHLGGRVEVMNSVGYQAVLLCVQIMCEALYEE
jgi:hypothetical protein